MRMVEVLASTHQAEDVGLLGPDRAEVDANVARLVRLAGLDGDDGPLRDQLEALLLRRPPAVLQASAQRLHGLRSVAGACDAATAARVRKAYDDARLLVAEIQARLDCGTVRQACEALAGQPKRPSLSGRGDGGRWARDWVSLQRRYHAALRRLGRMDDRNDTEGSTHR